MDISVIEFDNMTFGYYDSETGIVTPFCYRVGTKFKRLKSTNDSMHIQTLGKRVNGTISQSEFDDLVFLEGFCED